METNYMSLSHGSKVVSALRLICQNRFLDFGFGFYTITNPKQLGAFADMVFKLIGIMPEEEFYGTPKV